ncbi:MAG: LytTR family DNA-binding domain-containing protein [Flavipsychrobacter sp.]|nr:LytTR family DNA-binding domain-containing protein [Flavipsychrobacter sp.]
MSLVKKINAIIIDDEENAINNLKYYISCFCPSINIVGTSNKAIDFLRFINTTSFDLAFLDIHIFDVNIFDILRQIQKQEFKIILVTAYDNYAIKAIKYDVFDYLLKPISNKEFLHTAERINQHFEHLSTKKASKDMVNLADVSRKVIFRDSGSVQIVDVNDIFLFIAKGVYTVAYYAFNGTQRTTIMSRPLNQIEKELVGSSFFRIHKSYLININKIEDIHKDHAVHVMLKNQLTVPVAKRRVQDFLSHLI